MTIEKKSPNKRFSGHIVLPEYLNILQVRAFEEAIDLQGKGTEKNDKVLVSVLSEARIPALLKCVEEWHIKGVPEKPTLETFPMTPIADAGELVSWAFNAVFELWRGETEIPNG